MKNYLLILITSIGLFSGCIEDDIIDDFVPARLSIINPIDSLQIDDQYQFEIAFFNNVGEAEDRAAMWESSDQSIITIDQQGLATAIDTGQATVTTSIIMEDNTIVEDQITFQVSQSPTVVTEQETERSGVIQTTTFYTLEGDFILSENGSGGLTLSIADNYAASSGLPGLYVYLTNNPNSIGGALEISKVTIFQGAHEYDIPNAGLNDYSHLLFFCKPFSVKVGDAEIE